MREQRKLELLIVDDDPTVARTTQRLMRGRHECRIALSGAEALAAIEASAPDAIICDYDMAPMDGAELLEIVARSHPRVRRILYSGSRPEMWQALLDRGLVQAVIGKPASAAQLLAALD